jgi:hypothetical protein
MEYLVHHVLGLKILVAAAQVYESSRCEHALFVENQANPPGPALDRSPAVTALGHSSRRSLGPIDSREPALRQALLSDPFEVLPIRDTLTCFSQGLQEWLGTLIGRTCGVEP